MSNKPSSLVASTSAADLVFGLDTGSTLAPRPAQTRGTAKRQLPAFMNIPKAHAPLLQTEQLPLFSSAGCQLVYVEVKGEVEWWCSQLLASQVSVLGFDIEWLVTFATGETPRPTALIQLCHRLPSGSCQCLLLHIAHTSIPPSLHSLLTRQVPAKAGVGIAGDAQKLFRDFGLEVRGLVCLSEEANMRMQDPRKWSLADLAKKVLQQQLTKSQHLRLSNWEQRPLSAEQLRYAADDAVASLRIYEALQRMPVRPQSEPQLLPPQAPAEPSGGDKAPGTGSIIPALPQQQRLPPAKLATYKLFTEQGMCAEAIAVLRRVQRDTVEGYLADAITAGCAYNWHRLQVPSALVDAVKRLVADQMATSALPTPAATASSVMLPGSHDGQEVDAMHSHAEAKLDPTLPGGSLEPTQTAPMHQGDWADQVACLQKTCLLEQRLREVETAEERAARWLNQLGGIKQLKMSLPEDVSYGRIRLALAHLARCSDAGESGALQ